MPRYSWPFLAQDSQTHLCQCHVCFITSRPCRETWPLPGVPSKRSLIQGNLCVYYKLCRRGNNSKHREENFHRRNANSLKVNIRLASSYSSSTTPPVRNCRRWIHWSSHYFHAEHMGIYNFRSAIYPLSNSYEDIFLNKDSFFPRGIYVPVFIIQFLTLTTCLWLITLTKV